MRKYRSKQLSSHFHSQVGSLFLKYYDQIKGLNISELDLARQLEALGWIELKYDSSLVTENFLGTRDHLVGSRVGWTYVLTPLGNKNKFSPLPKHIKRTEITAYENYRSNLYIRAFKLWLRRWWRKLRLIGHAQPGPEAIR